MINKLFFKRDFYSNARGKYSRCINVCCRKCNNLILTYQKDGPGNLRRLYFDRIFSPNNLVNLQNKKLENISYLKCSKCKELLGIPYVYKKEKRKSFKLFQDVVVKKLIKLN